MLFTFKSCLRDGPLEKLWGGGGFSSRRNFFRYHISTLCARDFSSAVSGLCQVFIVTRAKGMCEGERRKGGRGRGEKIRLYYSLRSKRFQSSYCAKVREGAKKMEGRRVIPFLRCHPNFLDELRRKRLLRRLPARYHCSLRKVPPHTGKRSS